MNPKESVEDFKICLLADLRANRGHWRSIIFVVLFRLAHFTRNGPAFARVMRLPMGALYRVISEVLLSVEIPIRTSIGAGLRLRHGFGLVVHRNATIGSRVILRHGVTLGVRHTGDTRAPRIGDDVDFGANAIVLGGVGIGRGAVIAAGSVVITDVPDFAIVVGSPGRVVGFKPHDSSSIGR